MIILFISVIIQSTLPIKGENTVSNDLKGERGIPFIDGLECSDSGICLVFYSRVGDCIGDCAPRYKRYIKIFDVNEDFNIINTVQFENVSESGPREIRIAKSAENKTVLKVLGWIEQNGLYEITFNKENFSVDIKKVEISDNCDNYPYFNLKFNSNIRNQDTDFSDFDLLGQKGSIHPTDLIRITNESCTIISNQIQNVEGYLPINSSFTYFFTWVYSSRDLTIFEWHLDSDPKEIYRISGSTYMNSFIGNDLVPYLQYHIDNNISHIIRLDNLKDIGIMGSTYNTEIIIDVFSNIHYITLINKSQFVYQKVYQNGTIAIFKNLESINVNSTLNLLNLYNKTFLVSEYQLYSSDIGFFVLDTFSGSIITIKTNLITYVKTTDYSSFAIIISLSVLVKFRFLKKKNK